MEFLRDRYLYPKLITDYERAGDVHTLDGSCVLDVVNALIRTLMLTDDHNLTITALRYPAVVFSISPVFMRYELV